MGYIAFNANTVTAQEAGAITGTSINVGSGAVTGGSITGTSLNVHSTNINANGNGSSIISTSIRSVVQNTYYTIYTWADNFKITLYSLLVAFEDNDADGNNTSAFFTSPGTGAFSSNNQNAIRISGSTTLEVRNQSNQLQIRTTSASATGTTNKILHFTLINHLGT